MNLLSKFSPTNLVIIEESKLDQKLMESFIYNVTSRYLDVP